MSDPTTKTTIWTRASAEGSSESSSILVGRRVSPEWLTESLPLMEVRFVGELYDALADLFEAAKAARLNLPITSLRTALTAGLDNVVSLDRDLGLNRQTRVTLPAALTMYRPVSEDRDLVVLGIRKYLKIWMRGDVETWAQRHNMGELATKIAPLIDKAPLQMTDVDGKLLRPNKQPDYALISRAIGERMVGEELFPGLGACEIVASPESRSNYIELMTLPVVSERGDSVFSMVARITACSMPYSHDVYIGVSTMKRVWAKRVPKVSMHMPMRVTGYVMARGRPALMVTVERRNNEWKFGENYEAAWLESEGKLPKSLQEAVEQREFDKDKGWWAGLPELPSLFRSLSQRSAFEADEVSLLQTVSKLLGSVLTSDRIPIRESSRSRWPRKNNQDKQEMLKTSDLDVAWGAAGNSLVSEAAVDEMEDTEESERDESSGLSRIEKLKLYLDQNQRALQMMGDLRPNFIKVYGGTPEEKKTIGKAVSLLFGDNLQVIHEVLPDKTHGLRVELDEPGLSAKSRFESRLKRWQRAVEDIRHQSGNKLAIALICAPERVGTKMEDPVNYYAGIHAFSTGGANMHHLLPIEDPDNPKSRQAFLYRTQSALLDVVLAHSGIVFGTKRFFASLMNSEDIPRAVYGIQAVRSRARSRSGELGVTFILYTRLIIETGMTEIQIVYRAGRTTERTQWMPLSLGLQWVGSQRRLHEGDDIWLKDTFKDATRDTLAALHEEDPKAIVMIDWQSVANLWPGIRDEDLRPGQPPKLDNISLASFAQMSFVRLRRGADTLALRTASRKVYEGWKEGESRSGSGEIFVDEYFTTKKKLVEVTEEGSTSRNYGHYIATMGYAKTVQIKRGFSCYRPTKRIRCIGPGLSEFKDITLDPANFDAALPAPMDITVMSAPTNVSTEVIAMIVMGLRLGYAHYNDWTTLPAPLFFRRKIEDYIIRFPEDEDISVSPVTEDITESNPQATQLELLLQDSDLAEDKLESEAQAKPEPEPEPEESLAESTPEEDFARPLEDDLLSRAKRTELPFLPAATELTLKRLYKRMMQDKHGEVQVHVRLPYWVKTQGLFGPPTNLVRRNASKIWRTMIEFEYVVSGVGKPKDNEFLDRLAERLIVPQASIGIVTACSSIGGLMFEPLRVLIEEVYNPAVEQDDQVDPRRIRSDGLLRMMEWADTCDHDELAAWLIFLVTQHTSKDWPEIALGGVSRIYGPRTEDALRYYLDCCSALEDAIKQKGQPKFVPVVRYHKRQEPPPEPAPVARAPDLPVLQEPAPADVVPDTIENDTTQGRVMEIKQYLTRTIKQLEIGSERFLTDIENMGLLIEELKVLHQHELDRSKQDTEHQLRLAALAENYGMVIQELNAMHAELDLSLHRYQEPASDEELILSEAAPSKLRCFIEDIRGLQAELDKINSTPEPKSMLEQHKRNTRRSEILTSVVAVTEDLKAVLERTPCIVADTGDTPPEPDNKMALPEMPAPEATIEPQTEAELQMPAELVEVLSLDSAPQVAKKAATEIAQEVIAEAAAPEVIVEAALEPKPPVVVMETTATEAPIVTTFITTAPDIPVEVRTKEGVVPGGVYMDENEFLETLEQDIEVLRKLVSNRYYGLADVTVEALKGILAKSKDKVVHHHHVILRSLVRALYAMDCQYDFASRMDSELMGYLEENGIDGCEPCDPAMAALGVLAAGLSGMLFDPSGSQWGVGNEIQTRVTGYGAVAGLVGHINDIRQRGIPLSRDMFRASHVGEKQAIEIELQRMQKRATNWKDSAEIFSNWKHRGYQRLHDEIFSHKGSIGQCLALIEKGDFDKLKAIYPDVRRKLDRGGSTIDETFRHVDRGRPEGPYRERAIENLERTRGFIDNYIENVQRLKNPVQEIGHNYLDFVTRLHELMLEAMREINAMKPRTNLERLYCESAHKAIDCAIRLYSDSEPPACVPQDQQKLLLQLAMDQTLMPNLEAIDAFTPPLHTPRDVVAETERWAEEDLSLTETSDSILRALLDAMKGHIAAKRFMPAFRIVHLLPKSMVQGEGLLAAYNNEKRGFRDALQVASQRVTHALSLDAVQTEKAHRMQWFISEIQNALKEEKSIGSPENTLTAYPDFPQARAALRSNVSVPLDEDLYKASEDLRSKLERFEEERGPDVRDDVKRVRAMLEDNNAANLRTAHDAWMMLSQGQPLPERMEAQTDFGGLYDQFISEILKATANKQLLPTLCDILSTEPSVSDPECIRHLDRAQRAEAIVMIDTWLEVFKFQNLSHNDSALAQLFRQMGFTHEIWFTNELGRRRLRFNIDYKSFVFLSRDDDDVFIPPALGSRATHIQGLVMEGNPSENNLMQLIPEINGTPTLVLAHMRNLDMTARARVCRSSTAIILDDYLICYIALNPGRHIQALMRVAVLTYSSNPYDDYNGTPVPQEMFFGRRTELQRINEIKSSGILFGGRRLGKSSLLSQIETEMRGKSGNTAIYISMDTIDLENHVASAWSFVYKHLVERSVIMSSPSLKMHKAVDIQMWIEKELAAKKELRQLFLLIDEADRLMGRELKLNSGEVGFVRGMQQMIDNMRHSMQVRYVIAGLHNTARMASDENSVFGKVDAIALEPFNTQDDIRRGIRLITKPLAAMGYLFKADGQDLPLRILSVCNFYPAFIQLYCRELVTRLQNKQQSKKPPIYIEARDLDAVENDSSLLTTLRTKFGYNLDLDKRYRAIALILADIYYTEVGTGNNNGLTTSDIRDYCEIYAGDHFKNTGIGVYEALLDEMRKLNIIDRNSMRYVLRNPGIAMMMGNHAAILAQITDLAKMPPEDTRNQGDSRIHLRQNGNLQSPLFPYPVGWIRRQMETDDGELLIVTGNKASGIDTLSNLGREDWKLGNHGLIANMLGSGPTAANDLISKQRRSSSPMPRIVALRQHTWHVRQLEELAAIAAKARKVGIRLALVAPPEEALVIARQLDEGKLKRDSKGWSVVPIPSWTTDAVFFGLSENVKVAENPDAIQAILQATCGFGNDIERLCKKHVTVDEAMRETQRVRSDYAASLKAFYDHIGMPENFDAERRNAIELFLPMIDGVQRNAAEVEDYLSETGVTQGEMEFLQWMGLLQEGDNATWKVPSLYNQLIAGK